MRRPLAFHIACVLAALASAACGSKEPPGDAQGGSGGNPVAGTGGASGGAAPASGGNSSSTGGSSGSLGTGGVPPGSTGGSAVATGGAALGGGTSGAGAANSGGAAGAAQGGSAATTTGGAAGASSGGVAGKSGTGGASGGSAGTSGASGIAGSAGAGGGVNNRPARVLLYSFSTLNIPSVPAQLSILKSKLEGWQYQVEESKDPALFTDTNLARYAAVGMINTCFYPFGANKSGAPESQALQKFLQQGGGLFGTHCADVTFQSATPPALYNQLLGGRASAENFEGNSDCRKEGEHPSTTLLPATFRYTGNLDATDFLAPDTVVLVKCKWGNAAAKDVAVSWTRTEGAGRVFYTNFAKVDADLTNSIIGDNHIIAGLAWVLGR